MLELNQLMEFLLHLLIIQLDHSLIQRSSTFSKIVSCYFFPIWQIIILFFLQVFSPFFLIFSFLLFHLVPPLQLLLQLLHTLLFLLLLIQLHLQVLLIIRLNISHHPLILTILKFLYSCLHFFALHHLQSTNGLILKRHFHFYFHALHQLLTRAFMLTLLVIIKNHFILKLIILQASKLKVLDCFF